MWVVWMDHGWCLRLGMKYQNSSNHQKHRKTCYHNSGGEYGQPSHHPTRLHGWHHPSLSPPLSCSIEGLFQLSPLQNPSYPLEVLIQHVNAELKMYSISLSLLFVTSLFHDYSCTLVLIIIRTISYAIAIIIMTALLLVWLCSDISYDINDIICIIRMYTNLFGYDKHSTPPCETPDLKRELDVLSITRRPDIAVHQAQISFGHDATSKLCQKPPRPNGTDNGQTTHNLA